MTDIIQCQSRLREVERRANEIKPYSYAHLLCGSTGWGVMITNLKIHESEFSTPFAALDALESAMDKIEDRDGALARTLGLVA
jgi:hypothetical protein